MSNAVSGLLGGIMGVSNAVNELSAERRREMAIALRQEALAELERKSQERGFKQQDKLQGADIAAGKEEGAANRAARATESEADRAARATESAADITSREKIASDRNAMLEKLSKAEMGMKQQVLNMDKKSTEAQKMNAIRGAFTEARKVLEGGGTTEEANAVLEAVGAPPLEEFIKEEGSPGYLGGLLFGMGKKEPVIGRRIQRGGGEAAMPPTGIAAPKDGTPTPASANTETDNWMKKWVDRSKGGGKAEMGTAMAADEPTGETKKTSIGGLIDSAQTESKATGYEVDGKEIFKVKDEMVVLENGKFRPLTDDEWERRKMLARKPKDKKAAVEDFRSISGKLKSASEANPNPLSAR